MTPRKKTKIALDENRMSILGVQILFGFQLQAPFQKMFDALPESSQLASVLAFGLLIGAIALLITPSAYHRIVTRHGAEGQLQHGITWLIDISLLLLGLAIGLDLYLVGDRVLGGVAGPLLGIGFCLTAFVFWYGIELMHLTRRTRPLTSGNGEESRLEDRIDYVLTEARVVLPGVQALLGFQLIVTLSESFGKLPESSVLVHLAALAVIALSAVLLIAPAAHHRIVFGGEDSEEFLPIASRYLLAATVFLALGMAGDCYVIVAKVLESPVSAVAAAAVTAVICLGLWHVWPWMVRNQR
ncbi:MAG TPA: DUF6328 family protein [Dongiaceae bacterium]|nr:DUF6328 family protein [Dongiaceae bacterium]